MLVFKALNAAESVSCTFYRDYEKTEELNGALQISFTVPKTADNSAVFSLLDYETEVVDQDGNVYIVKQLRSNHTTKSAVAIHKFFTLSDVFRHDIIGGEKITLKTLCDLIFNGSGFTYSLGGTLKATQTLVIYNFGGATATSLLDTLREAIGADRYITGANTVLITNDGGVQSSHVFEYATNIKTLEYEADTTNIKTVIRGFSEQIPGATVYKSPNAATFGEREAEPYENNELTTTAAMIAELKAQLQDEPEITISLDVLTLDANVGERVYLFHKPLGLNMTTRVLARTTARDRTASSITIGNTVRRSLGDVLAEQQADITTNERYTRSRFEQTRDRITAEVESIGDAIATLDIKADKISSNVKDLEEGTSSTITQTASKIRSEIADAQKGLNSTISQTATTIRSEIADEVDGLSSSINQTTKTIRQEIADTQKGLNSTISQTTTTIRQEIADEVKGLNSTINQTATTLRSEIKDAKENAASTLSQTATAIRGEVSNSITTVTNSVKSVSNDVGTLSGKHNDLLGNVSALSNDLNSLSGKITTNTNNIASVKLTADSINTLVSNQIIQISDLGTRVSNAETSIDQYAGEITARVKTTDFTGNTIISKINLNSTTATISARNINLQGAVTVLSNITGDLGTITAGTINSVNINSANINISDDLKIGRKVYLTGGSSSNYAGIYFDRFGTTGKIYSNGNNMVLYSDAFEMSSMYGINVYSGMSISGGLTVDGGATIKGGLTVPGTLTTSGYNVAYAHTSGIGIAYSSDAKRLYVRVNGSNVGFVNLT